MRSSGTREGDRGASGVNHRRSPKLPMIEKNLEAIVSNDGDHPDAAEHQQIATATGAVIESALHI